jgi:hypothetical protein
MHRVLLSSISLVLCLAPIAFAGEPVTFFRDRIAHIDRQKLTLEGGSRWTMTSRVIASAKQSVVVVFTRPDSAWESPDCEPDRRGPGCTGLMIVGRQEVGVTFVRGAFPQLPGMLATVVDEHNDGVILVLDDESRWQVHPSDQAEAAFWPLPCRVIVYSDGHKLLNAENTRAVAVRGLGPESKAAPSGRKPQL